MNKKVIFFTSDLIKELSSVDKKTIDAVIKDIIERRSAGIDTPYNFSFVVGRRGESDVISELYKESDESLKTDIGESIAEYIEKSGKESKNLRELSELAYAVGYANIKEAYEPIMKHIQNKTFIDANLPDNLEKCRGCRQTNIPSDYEKGESIHLQFMRAISGEAMRNKDKRIIKVSYDAVRDEKHPYLFALAYRNICECDPENIPLFFDRFIELNTNKGYEPCFVGRLEGDEARRAKYHVDGEILRGIFTLSNEFALWLIKTERDILKIAIDRWVKKSDDQKMNNHIIKLYENYTTN